MATRRSTRRPGVAIAPAAAPGPARLRVDLALQGGGSHGFQAVHIGDEAYWDGGYAGNPSLLPLVADSASDDLLLVQINPGERAEVPKSAGDILERVSEITFNASLVKELRQITLLHGLVDLVPHAAAAEGVPALALRLRRLRLHRVDGGAALARFGADTKTNTSPAFLKQLFDLGRQTAEARSALQPLRHGGGQRPELCADSG